MTQTLSAADLTIVYRDPRSLTLYDRNPKQHPRAQLRKLRKSIATFGLVSPIVLDGSGTVICGAGRLTACLELGLKRVPTVTLDNLSEGDRAALVIADNKIAEQGSYNKRLLRAELRGLLDIGYEVELTGLDTLEIDMLLSIDDEDQAADDIVELPDDRPVVTRPGDIWDFGDHRLICGDARAPETYERLLGGERAQMVFTDPPYGCRIENNVSGLGRVKHGDFLMGAGETSDAEFAMGLLRPALRCLVAHSAPGAVVFVRIDWRGQPQLLDAARGIMPPPKNMIVWAKTNAGNGSFYRPQHELIYVFQASRGELINNFGLGAGGRYRSNLWTYPGANVFRRGRLEDLADHPTVKPRKLVADAILDCSRPGGLILDGFAGAGTTLVAAAMTERRGYGVELDPRFCDVIVRRLCETTGAAARLEGGPTFAEVAVARGIAL